VTFTGTLYPYQQESVNRMAMNMTMLVSADMGTGKTVMTEAAVEQLMEWGDITEPGIVVCLSTLKYQWQKSIHKFTDSKALVIDGTKPQRLKQYQEAKSWKKSGYDYIIMSYETLVSDYKSVADLPRGFLVLDEATAIKSFSAKRSRAVKRLAKGCKVKFALTGTPMDNGKAEELFSIMQAVNPKVLGSFRDFDSTYIIRNGFGWIEGYKNLDRLHSVMKDWMIRLRQTDPEVAAYMPDTIYREPIMVRMDRAGARTYRKIAADLVEDIEEAMGSYGSTFSLERHYGVSGDAGESAMRGKIASKITALRMLCDHPHLLEHSAYLYNSGSGDGSAYIAELKADGYLDGLTKAPKMVEVKKYLTEFLEADPDNKVVIFSVFVPTLDILRDEFIKYNPVVYSGKMNAKQKEAAKVEFQTDPNCRVFISSDAGGYGVDLPEGNLLFNYDMPWASGTQRQRNGRIQRASSAWDHVIIQNIIVAGSIEERQWDMLLQKNRLEAAIIDGEGITKRGGIDMNVSTLKAFLVENSV
jgi:SNF2 family DNA or RNA helicase